MPDWGARYREWVDKRVALMDRVLRPDLWRGRRVLEVGAGHGWIGDALRERGATVTHTDGRPEYVREGGLLLDLDGDIEVAPHDAVVAFGVLYHVRAPLRVLAELCEVAPLMLMETEVLDSDDPAKQLVRGEGGWDGAVNGCGVLRSAAAFEQRWDALGWRYRRFDDAALNTAGDTYDWTVQGGGAWVQGYRRFWVAWRAGVPCPLVEP